MTCTNCDLDGREPGKAIKVTNDLEHCAVCGGEVNPHDRYVKVEFNARWDTYFHSICLSVASKSPCLSRKIGAILVKDKVIVATGFNGPARGIPHCGRDRYQKDEMLSKTISGNKDYGEIWGIKDIGNTCPRKLLGYRSGQGLHLCTAEHAERNCIASAARVGVSTKNTTLYMNCVLPCKNCIILLINAGVKEIVIEDTKHYDEFSDFIYNHCTIKIRKFEI